MEYKFTQKKPTTNYLSKYGKITGYGSPLWDKGLDVDLQKGDPVYAHRTGEVIFAGKNGGFGNQIKVKDRLGNILAFSHLDNIETKVGDRVKQNQIIGLGGNTGNVIPINSDGSHLDLTGKKADGSYMSAKEVKEYLEKKDYSSMAEGIIKMRKQGNTDTEIADYLMNNKKDFRNPILTARSRFETDDKIKNDRDLVNFLAKRFSGVDNLSVASNPIKNEFMKQGYTKEQIVAQSESLGIDKKKAIELFDNNKLEDYIKLVQLKKKEELLNGKGWRDGPLSLPAAGLESASNALFNISSSIAQFAQLDHVVGYLGEKIGAYTSMNLAGAKELKSKLTDNKKDSFGNVVGSTIKAMANGTNKGKDVGKTIGEEIGKTVPLMGASFIPLVGPYLDAVALSPIAFDTLDDVRDKNYKKASIEAGLGLLGIFGVKKAFEMDKITRAASKLKSSESGLLRKTSEKFRDITEDMFVNLPKKREKISQNILKSFQDTVRPPVSRFKSALERNKFYNKLVGGAKSIAENKKDLTFTKMDGEIITGQMPSNLEEATQAVSQTKRKLFKEFDELSQNTTGAGVKIKTEDIASELEKVANDKILKSLKPEISAYAQKLAKGLRETVEFTPQEMQDAIKQMNDSLQAFYKNPDYNSASKVVIDAGLANMMRKKLASTIENFTGDEYSILRSKYGELSELDTEINKLYQKELNKNKIGLIDYTDIFSGGEITAGILSGSPALFAKGMVQKGISTLMKKINSKDGNIVKIFKDADNMNRIQQKEWDSIRKMYSHSLDEANKNQKIIGGIVNKGYYIPTATSKIEALKGANEMMNRLRTGTLDSRLGANMHAWVKKGGKIFDTSLQKGFVKNADSYVSERELIDYMTHQNKFNMINKEPIALPAGNKTIYAADKYASMPNKGAIVGELMPQTYVGRGLDGKFKKIYLSGNEIKKLPKERKSFVDFLSENFNKEKDYIDFDKNFASHKLNIEKSIIDEVIDNPIKLKKTKDTIEEINKNLKKMPELIDEFGKSNNIPEPLIKGIITDIKDGVELVGAKLKVVKDIYKTSVEKIKTLFKNIKNNEKGFARLGFHVPRTKEAFTEIKSKGFNIKKFGEGSATELIGDPEGIYFFPKKSDITTEGWDEMAKEFGVIKSELNYKKPFKIQSEKDVDRYFNEIIKPATNTKFNNATDYFNDIYNGGDTTEYSKKIATKLKENGYDAIEDEQAILNSKLMDDNAEAQIIVLNPKAIKNKEKLAQEIIKENGYSDVKSINKVLIGLGLTTVIGAYPNRKNLKTIKKRKEIKKEEIKNIDNPMNKVKAKEKTEKLPVEKIKDKAINQNTKYHLKKTDGSSNLFNFTEKPKRHFNKISYKGADGKVFTEKSLSEEQLDIGNYVYNRLLEKGFKWPEYGLKLLWRESRWGASKDNVTGNYPKTSKDRGIYQINNYWHPEINDKDAHDLDASIDFMINMVNNGRQHEWTTNEIARKDKIILK